QARASRVAEYVENFANPYVAASRGFLDEIIEPSETREKLLTAFRLLETKRASLPSKKHDNIPL
ncbi:MAG TPA: carboxyl transferase domain-containing protein, partial [Thermoanaerobaculia bacterium]